MIKHVSTHLSDRMHHEQVLRVAVSTPRHPKPRMVELAQPFAVVGRADEADITLPGHGVSFRHAYLQRLAGRVLCIDLSSTTGTYWGDKRRSFGWLSPRKAVRIGRYLLSVCDDPADDEVSPNDGDERNSPAAPLEATNDLGRYVLEFFDDSVPEPIREIKHEIALVGRSSKCHIQVDDESVSRVHCALVPMVEGLLVVDLLGKDGTSVDHQRIRYSYVKTGSVLTVGRYDMSVWHRTSALPQAGNATVPAADTAVQITTRTEAAPLRLPGEQPEANDVDTRSAPADSQEPALEETSPPKTVSTKDVASPEPVSDWLGTLFAIEHHGTTLILIPKISNAMFRYQMLRTEASSLRRKLANLRGLVVDLHALGYVGWEVISLVVALAREMEASGGSAAFCCPTPQVQQVLTNMGLSRIWPAHPTREAALAVVNSRSEANSAK